MSAPITTTKAAANSKLKKTATIDLDSQPSGKIG